MDFVGYLATQHIVSAFLPNRLESIENDPQAQKTCENRCSLGHCFPRLDPRLNLDGTPCSSQRNRNRPALKKCPGAITIRGVQPNKKTAKQFLMFKQTHLLCGSRLLLLFSFNSCHAQPPHQDMPSMSTAVSSKQHRHW